MAIRDQRHANVSKQTTLEAVDVSPSKWRVCGRGSNRSVHEGMNNISNVKVHLRIPQWKCLQMSRVMRKPTFCICENKDADQLRGNREVDQRLLFSLHRWYNPSTFHIRNFKPLAIFCERTAWFVSDQIGNQNVCFLMTRLICRAFAVNVIVSSLQEFMLNNQFT